MKYTRLYSDHQGESHFEDVDVELSPLDFAPPAPPLDLSSPTAVARLAFLSAPSEWLGDWHPAPQKQFIIYLSGQTEAEASDGEIRIFGPGSVTLVEDIEGKGHRSRVISGDGVTGVVVRL